MTDTAPTFDTDLFGWDTMFCISFTKANGAISNNDSSPKNFELPWPSQKPDKRTLYGSWAPWRLEIGSSGGDIMMRCPVKKGSIWMQSKWVPRTEIDVSGIEMNVQCSLTNLDVQSATDRGLKAKELVPSQATGGTTQNLALNTEPTSPSQPACTVEWISWYITGTEKINGKDRYRTDLPDGIVINLALANYPKVESDWNDGTGNAQMVISLVSAAFTNYFNQYGLKEFTHIFAAFVVGANTKDPKWQWLKPHTVSYAVSMPLAQFATLDNCYLGVLALTQPGKVPSTSMSQQIDGRIGQAFPNADSVFAISHELFLNKWLYPGVRLAIPTTTETDWRVDATGTTISNTKDLVIGTLYSNEGKTETTDAHVKEGGWNLILDTSSIRVDISGVEFNWNGPGELTKDGYKVSAGYKDWYELELKSGTDSKGTPYKNVLHAKQAANTKPTPTFQLTETSAERWSKLALDVGISIIGSLIGGAIAKAIVTPAAAAAEGAIEVTAQGATGALEVGVDTTAEGVSEAITTVGTETSAELTAEGVTEGSTEITADTAAKISSKPTTFLGRMWANRWVIVGSTIGGGVGAALGDIPLIMKNCAVDELSKIATFENFADLCVDGMEWPGNDAGFQLTDVQLRKALLLGGTLTKTN